MEKEALRDVIIEKWNIESTDTDAECLTLSVFGTLNYDEAIFFIEIEINSEDAIFFPGTKLVIRGAASNPIEFAVFFPGIAEAYTGCVFSRLSFLSLRRMYLYYTSQAGKPEMDFRKRCKYTYDKFKSRPDELKNELIDALTKCSFPSFPDDYFDDDGDSESD